MGDKLSLLKQYWKHDGFRPLQEEVIDSVLAGNDTLVLLPTGGGKSLCYQLPSLMREGLCLVVSPLIALMKDQVHTLNERGIPAACITSGMTLREIETVLNNCLYGNVKFLYVSPERLRQRLFLEHYRQMSIGLIAVDEAHCVSQWGYDFRPPYLQIADIRAYHPQTPLVALTATATPEVVDDIREKLKMRGDHTFRSSFARANLTYSVIHDSDKTMRLLRIVKSIGGSGIVYTRRRSKTKNIAEWLQHNGITATYFHAGLDAKERDTRQSLWMGNKLQVMVATNAFGMGIDKPDVRFVVHVDAPDSLEAYFQEAGRAGRDGKQAYAYMICNEADRSRLDEDFACSYPSVKYIRNVYRAIGNYYKIPLGSGTDSSYDFSPENICRTYDFTLRDFYSACGFLEREGLISLPDLDESFSTLFIPTSRETLYKFQVNNVVYGNLLQTIMRMYPGVMTVPVKISEQQIGSRCYLEARETARLLTELHSMHLLEYTPRKTKPQIVFPCERVNEKGIFLGEENYNSLKLHAEQRLDAVKRYMDNDHTCRSRQLLAYFGETDGVVDCGKCDVCTKHDDNPEKTKEAILALLAHGKQTAQGLRIQLESEGYRNVVEIVRDLLDNGLVYIDKNLLLSVS